MDSGSGCVFLSQLGLRQAGTGTQLRMVQGLGASAGEAAGREGTPGMAGLAHLLRSFSRKALRSFSRVSHGYTVKSRAPHFPKTRSCAIHRGCGLHACASCIEPRALFMPSASRTIRLPPAGAGFQDRLCNHVACGW